MQTAVQKENSGAVTQPENGPKSEFGSCSNCHQSPHNIDAKLAAKLVRLMKALSCVPKDKANKLQNYRYLSSDGLLARVNPACVEAGLSTVIQTEIINWKEVTKKGGMICQLVAAKVIITIIDADTGSSITTEGIGMGEDPGDKAFSKAQTQARKYAWMLALNISTGDDPEADEKTDSADEPPVQCRKCKKDAFFVKTDEFEGQKVKCYKCVACKTETRVKS